MCCDIISDSGVFLLRKYKVKNRTHALKMMKNKARKLGVKMFDEVKRKNKRK